MSAAYIVAGQAKEDTIMIVYKKTVVLSQCNDSGVSGVARFELFKDRLAVQIRLAQNRRAQYAAVATGGEMRIFRLTDEKVYIGRLSLQNDVAVIISDANANTLARGAGIPRYDYAKLLQFATKEIVANSGGEQQTVNDIAQPDGEKLSEQSVLPAEEQKTSEVANKDEQTVKDDAQSQYADSLAKEIDKVIESLENIDKTDEKEQQVSQKEDISTECAASVNDSVQAQATAIAEDGEKGGAQDFYMQIKQKMDQLFSLYPEDKELGSLIPQSRWVTVKGDGGEYVVGTVGQPVQFICYGVPDVNGKNPPDAKQECRQWLELEKGGRGYWMMYQSAKDGSTLTAV